jgi:PIN domain nuclease of toxin-antitoxin system
VRRVCGNWRSSRRRDARTSPPICEDFGGALLTFGWQEVVVTSLHALAIGGFPPIHKDPFDRILLAQAIVEGALLLTADPILARYPGPVRLV